MNKNYNKDSIDDLLKRSLEFKDTKEYFKLFRFLGRFRHYSNYNTMMVHLQNEAITAYGGVGFWKDKFNRTIKEDAKVYVILQPFAPIMPVYDVMDTEGEEPADVFLKNGVGRKLFDVKGVIPPTFLDNIIKIVNSWGIKVKFKPLSFIAGGYVTTIYSNKLEISLKEEHTKEQNFATLIHELAHLFLGHTGHELLKKKTENGKEKEIRIQNRVFSISAQELEAESVSYIVCTRFGLETESEKYLAGYITNKRDFEEFSFENVIKTADKIENLFLKNRRKK